MNELPEELIEKLRVIEKEMAFFSQAPSKPGKPNVFTLICDALLVVSIVIMFMMDASSLVPYLLTIVFINGVVDQLHRNKLYKNYATACEIIDFYKNKESPRT